MQGSSGSSASRCAEGLSAHPGVLLAPLVERPESGRTAYAVQARERRGPDNGYGVVEEFDEEGHGGLGFEGPEGDLPLLAVPPARSHSRRFPPWVTGGA